MDKTPLTMPNHDTIKGSTLRVICRQSGIKRNGFLKIYQKVQFIIIQELKKYLALDMEL